MDYERVSEKEWEIITHKSDNAYLFCSPIWSKIIEKTYDYLNATRLYYVDSKPILVPMMEKHMKYGFKSFSSMPFGYGGFFSESPVTTDELTKITRDIIGGRHLSFNLTLQPFEDISPGKSAVEINDEWNYTHVLNLEGRHFEDIWKKYEKKTRGHIRKAVKSGLEVREGTSSDDFKEFYDIWSKSSQKWGYETPPHPFKLFQNFRKYGNSHVRLSLATKDNQTIAGLISFYFNKTIILWTSAFLGEYGRLNPTRLLDNSVIEKASQEDYKYLNFGGSGKLRALRRYKEGFGAEKVEIKKYRVSSNIGKVAQFLNSRK